MKNQVSAPKIYRPDYKVRRLGGGLYSVEIERKVAVYISRTRFGSKSFYHIKGAPLFPTLRDAVMHVVFG